MAQIEAAAGNFLSALLLVWYSERALFSYVVIVVADVGQLERSLEIKRVI